MSAINVKAREDREKESPGCEMNLDGGCVVRKSEVTVKVDICPLCPNGSDQLCSAELRGCTPGKETASPPGSQKTDSSPSPHGF